MDDPLNPTAQQQLEDELKKQNEDFGDGDPDGEASEVIDIDEAPKSNLEETVIVNNDLNTTIITTDDEQ